MGDLMASWNFFRCLPLTKQYLVKLTVSCFFLKIEINLYSKSTRFLYCYFWLRGKLVENTSLSLLTVAILTVTSPIVINVPTRGLLAVETKDSFVLWLAKFTIKRLVCKQWLSLFLLDLLKLSTICKSPLHWPRNYVDRTWERSANRPFYSCLLSDLAFAWQRGWRWPCFETDLSAFVV